MSKPDEKEPGHFLHLGQDVYCEVSVYNGRIYVSLRRWFQADDGDWYRTKNGLHLRIEAIKEVLAKPEELTKFINAREASLKGV